MKRKLGAVSVLAVILLPVVAVAQMAMPVEEQQVKRANAEFFRALSEQDPDIWDQRVADDAFLLGFGVGTNSKDNALASWAVSPANAVRITPAIKRLKIQADTAVVVSQVTIGHADNAAPLFVMNYMNVLTKRDGRWVVIASTPVDSSVYP